MFREKRDLQLFVPDGFCSDGVHGYASRQIFNEPVVVINDRPAGDKLGYLVLGTEVLSTEPGHIESGRGYPDTSRGLAELTGTITGADNPALDNGLAELGIDGGDAPIILPVYSNGGHVGYVYDGRRNPEIA